MYGGVRDGIDVVGGRCRGKVSHTFIGSMVMGEVLPFFQDVEWGCGLDTVLLG